MSRKTPWEMHLDEIARRSRGYGFTFTTEELLSTLYRPRSAVDEMRDAVRRAREGMNYKHGPEAAHEWTYRRGTAHVKNRDGQSWTFPDAVREVAR